KKASSANVIIIDLTIENLMRIFKRLQMHETYLLDELGNILLNSNISKIINHNKIPTYGLTAHELAAVINGGVKEYKNKDGEEIIGAYSKVQIGRMTVLAQIEKRQALAANRKLIERSLMFAGIILLAAFIASIIFSRLITSPIRKLTRASKKVGEGNYNIDVNIHSRDEIGDLSRSFMQMAKSLKEAQHQLVQSEKLAAFGRLGAGITHEVKNPLTGIIGFAQIAQRMVKKDKEKAEQLLKKIEYEGNHCQEILSNFLKFAHADNEVIMQKIDFNYVVKEAEQVFRHTLSVQKVQIHIALAKEKLIILGNVNQLEQVLLNLAINAQQAMPNGGNVYITTELTNNEFVLCTVADDGPGIAENIINKIFDPFVTTKPVGQGTGLGLSICNRIIHDHKGIINVTSEIGKGATFYIRIPALKNELKRG
ncbi:MAG: HAMP domain-containing protein, partial [Deltaproteobacteria bacterium]|nr:HAMP domain-containing protein [Deltaproteobacteria bacterium]